jgi:hypothetical protein
MNKAEALSVLRSQLAAFASRSYSQLIALIGKPSGITVRAASGVEYQIEFNVFFDSGAHDDLRIVGSIDDGGWRAVVPFTKTLIMKPNGEML